MTHPNVSIRIIDPIALIATCPSGATFWESYSDVAEALDLADTLAERGWEVRVRSQREAERWCSDLGIPRLSDKVA